ncbi:MAG: zinc metalloprotease HtpX [Solirubrobacteraceae bacterium]
MSRGRQLLGRDTGLQARMTLTLFLLGLLYTVLVVALIAANVSIVLIVIIAGGFFLVQTLGSDKIALTALGAHEVTVSEEPELHAIIERLCIQADLPKPRVAVIEARMPNACAMGRSPKQATVCATRGILQLLSPAELEGVLAHEITHVINRDVMVMTMASFFATVAALIIRFSFFFGAFGGGGGNRDEAEAIELVILVSVLVYAISFILLRALSRYREFAADRGSAILTGRPSALASALIKVTGAIESGAIPRNDLRTAEGMSAFFIVPARTKNSLMNLFSDHPPLEKRLAALQRL